MTREGPARPLKRQSRGLPRPRSPALAGGGGRHLGRFTLNYSDQTSAWHLSAARAACAGPCQCGFSRDAAVHLGSNPSRRLHSEWASARALGPGLTSGITVSAMPQLGLPETARGQVNSD